MTKFKKQFDNWFEKELARQETWLKNLNEKLEILENDTRKAVEKLNPNNKN